LKKKDERKKLEIGNKGYGKKGKLTAELGAPERSAFVGRKIKHEQKRGGKSYAKTQARPAHQSTRYRLLESLTWKRGERGGEHE